MEKVSSRLNLIPWRHYVIIALIALVAVGAESCKSSGKLTRKERKAQIEMYKKQMREIINGTTTMSLSEQERAINDAINKNFGDAKLDQLILQASQKLKSDHSAKEKSNEQRIAVARNKLYDLLVNKQNLSADQLEAEMNKIKAENLADAEIDELIQRLETKINDMRSYSSREVRIKEKIESSFQSISNASASGDISLANSLIQATLDFFTAPDIPVLIIISREGGIVDYDKPTTIINYLNFLKDQKESRNSIDSYKLDTGGKIKELDLIKK